MSSGAWANYEYRAVPTTVAHRMASAGNRLHAALLEHVADRYAVRRCGTARWVEPGDTAKV